jgi:hypothetical protein
MYIHLGKIEKQHTNLGEDAGIKLAKHVEALEQVLDLWRDPEFGEALLIFLHQLRQSVL